MDKIARVTIMKSIKFVFVGILSLVLSFLLVGLIYTEEIQIFEIEIDKPVYKSFQIFNDPFSLPMWVTGLKDMKIISGDLEKPGSRHLMIIEQYGEKIEIIETLTAYEENKIYAFDYDNQFMTGSLETKFLDQGNKTKLVITNTYSGKNVIHRAVLHLMHSKIEQEQINQYKKLKEVIETTKWN